MKLTSLLYATFLVFLISSFKGFAQNPIHNYKYIVVPNQFEFQNQEDKYDLNALTKFLFNREGFQAYLQNETLPQDAVLNNCLVLTAIVTEPKAFLKTKILIELRNCKGEKVFTSREGVSKEKEYAKAFNLALRDAFKSFESLNYMYVPHNAMVSQGAEAKESDTDAQNEIELLKKELEALKTKKEQQLTPTLIENQTVTDAVESGLLEAKATPDGFVIIDAQGNTMMVLYRTELPDVYLVKDKNALVYKVSGAWMYFENDGEFRKRKVLSLKL